MTYFEKYHATNQFSPILSQMQPLVDKMESETGGVYGYLIVG